MSVDKTEALVEQFRRKMKESPTSSVGLNVIATLSQAIAESDSNTFMGVDQEISKLIDAIQKACPDLPLHFMGAAQVFRAGMSKASDSQKSDWKNIFAAHANQCLLDAEKVLNLIPDVSSDFLQHGMTILTRGFDPMVAASLTLAAADGRQFHVIVTEGRPLDDGAKMASFLTHPNLKVTIIPDASVGLWMNEVDALLIGTDLVLEDGGLLAPVGTYTMCVLASIHRRPVYCVCETFKFMRRFILNSGDLQSCQRKVEFKAAGVSDDSIECDGQQYDFTQAKYVTLLLTEKGPMPPSAVTHELTKLLGVS